MYIASNLHNAMYRGAYGDQRYGAVVSLNALQAIVSTCQSAKTALIFVRLLCVPPLTVGVGVGVGGGGG
jgi:hypothetical protein